MKRKIALVLAAAMTVAMLPMNAMANSTNTLSKSNTTLSDDEVLLTNIDDRSIDVVFSNYDSSSEKVNDNVISAASAITLQVRPTSEVKQGDSIILKVENGKFNENLCESAPFIFRTEKTKTTYDALVADGRDPVDVLKEYVGGENSRKLPYGFKYINANEIEVLLYPINDDKVNQNNSDVTQGTPYYDIALPIVTDGSEEGAVTVSIDDNDSTISATSHTVATVTDSDGSTTASVVSSDVNTTSDEIYSVPDITIKEDLAGTFDGQTIKVKLNGNYEWSDNSDGDIVAGVNCNKFVSVGKYSSDNKNGWKIDKRTLEFTLPDKSESPFVTSKTSSIIIKGFKAEAKDDDTYGDINVTISGDSGITTQTIKVGERQDYGFMLKALEEPTTIFAGRTPFDADADTDDFETAEFEFGETTPGTWLTGRKLEFSVPEGVKIVGYEITKTKYMDKFSTGKIVDDGTTLRFDSISSQSMNINENESSYFDIKLTLSTSIDFSGDVTVSVSGAGLDADTLSDLVVAKVVTPVTVEAATTKSNIGYKAVETADIKITENTYGALEDGKSVEITLDDTYSADLAFDDADTDIKVDGELEVKTFKVKNGKISFTIDSESYSAPSTITITGVAVGTTRSIPYGSYSITVGGDAIVNNYQENVDQKSTITAEEGNLPTKKNGSFEDDYEQYADFDLFEEDGFEFKNYLEVVTDTTTLDGVVEVTIGEKSIKMDGKTVDMDVAAYIQTSSNSTMVPLRFVTLALGVDQANANDADNSSKIAWDANTKTATIFYAAGSGQKIIQFQAGSATMTVDGVGITMDNGVVAEIVDGRMFVPFRALGQALGVPVSWDAETRTAIYNGQLAKSAVDTVDVEETEATTVAEETTEATTAEATTEAATEAE
ncbi:MAG: copper amine oxidase N-terminal domain-containing protein [Clostridia bacterium]|nr:copper amine oxidase N-terminal domain-containing protein [Clostridia bacterium]